MLNCECSDSHSMSSSHSASAFLDERCGLTRGACNHLALCSRNLPLLNGPFPLQKKPPSQLCLPKPISMSCFTCGRSDGPDEASRSSAPSNQLQPPPEGTTSQQPSPTQRCEDCYRFQEAQKAVWKIWGYKDDGTLNTKQNTSPHADEPPSYCCVKSSSARCRLTLEACKARRNEEAERIIKFFDALFTFVIGTAALGAGFTFPTILAKLDPAPTGKFHDSVQRFLAISWLLFILALASAGFFASIIGFGKDFAKYNWQFGTDHLDKHNKLRWFGALASGIPVMLLIAAFMFLSFVVVAYDERVGWAAVGASSLFGLAGALGTLLQSPIGDPVKIGLLGVWELITRLITRRRTPTLLKGHRRSMI